LGRGWIDAHVHQLPGTQADYDVRSRHFGSKSSYLGPQGVEIRGTDGKTYVIEFRENADWDAGQGTAAVIVNAAHGSTADAAYPTIHSATYLSMLRLPISFGGGGSVYNGSGFCVQILDVMAWSHSARIRVRPGSVSSPSVEIKKSKAVVTNTPVD